VRQLPLLHGGVRAQTTVFLNIGLQNGILVRSVLDPMSGKLSDTRHRSAFLGSLVLLLPVTPCACCLPLQVIPYGRKPAAISWRSALSRSVGTREGGEDRGGRLAEVEEALGTLDHRAAGSSDGSSLHLTPHPLLDISLAFPIRFGVRNFACSSRIAAHLVADALSEEERERGGNRR